MSQLNLTITVDKVALTLEETVVINPTDVFRVAVEAMSQKGLGIASVVDSDGKLVGVLTDGDIRRILLRQHKPIAALFSDDVSLHMTPDPKKITNDMALKEAVVLMETVEIFDLPIVDSSGRLTGLLHMHTALKHLLGL